MVEISVSKGTQYACNLKSKTDHLWLQSLSKRTKYACNVENGPRVTWVWFLDESRECNLRWLQAYLVTFGKHCKHIKFVPEERLQAYWVPYIIRIAGILILFWNNDWSILVPHFYYGCRPATCRHIQSSMCGASVFGFSAARSFSLSVCKICIANIKG